MTGDFTLSLIKPGAVSHEYIGPILHMINEAGFHIQAMKMLMLKREDAQQFYAVHRGKSFYEPLIDFMTSGPVVALVLEKENAVEDFRKLMGTTDPSKAQDGTIRKLFAESIRCNAVHGSDSNENARKEANFFFSRIERFPEGVYKYKNKQAETN